MTDTIHELFPIEINIREETSILLAKINLNSLARRAFYSSSGFMNIFLNPEMFVFRKKIKSKRKKMASQIFNRTPELGNVPPRNVNYYSAPLAGPINNINQIEVQTIVRQLTGGDYIVNNDQWHQAVQQLNWNGFPIYMTAFVLHPYYHPEIMYYANLQQAEQQRNALQGQINELSQQLQNTKNQVSQLSQKLNAAESRIEQLESKKKKKKKKKWFGWRNFILADRIHLKNSLNTSSSLTYPYLRLL